jgi:hypothetical protein
VASFAKGPKGLVIGITKADLEAQVAAATKPTEITAGMTVSGPHGNPVGTVESVSGDMITVATSTAKAQLPKTAFAKGPNGLVIGMSADQLNAAVAATAPAEITAGMAVSGPGGGAVGTIDSVSGDLVTVATANTKAQLPKTAFAKGPNGLVIGMTADQLEAAAKAAEPKAGGAGK